MTTLSDAHKQLLAELYNRTRRTRDDLPYTPDFERLHAEFVSQTGLPLTLHELWKALAGLGKASRLDRKSRQQG